MVFGGYEAFKYQNSLIGAVYPTAPKMKKLSRDEIEGQHKAKSQMMQTVAERGKYWYDYSEYLCAQILVSWCCSCFKKCDCVKRRAKRLKRHERAYEKLTDEIDIVKLLYVQRIGQFIAKLILRKHQRALITSFKNFKIDNLQEADAKVAGTALDDPEIRFLPGNNTSVQEDGTVSNFAQFEGNPDLTKK